jgi:hypothetical protein
MVGEFDLPKVHTNFLHIHVGNKMSILTARELEFKQMLMLHRLEKKFAWRSVT